MFWFTPIIAYQTEKTKISNLKVEQYKEAGEATEKGECGGEVGGGEGGQLTLN